MTHNVRSAPILAAALTAITTAGTASIAVPLEAQQGPGIGSQVPCAVPMSWTIRDIDPRFDLSDAWALQAAREAGGLWEQATGVELFTFGVDDGFPISFHFDDRQAALEARRERETLLDTERMGVEDRRAELEEASGEYESMLENYQRDARDHDWAVRAFNNDFMRWSRENEVPLSVQKEMERRRDELDRAARDIQNRQGELNRRSDTMRDDVRRFNERVEELRDLEEAMAQDFPASTAQSGRYDEKLSLRDDGPVATERRIRVFQFSSQDDLVLVIAHELGHALGLAHASGDGAVMSEVMMSGTATIPSGGVTPVDLRMLVERCPQLGG